MNNLETHVLELIGESTTSPDVFIDTDDGMAPVRDSLNDAIEEISMLTGSHKQTYQIPLVEDQGLYRLKFTRGYFGWVTDAWLVNKTYRLDQTDLIKLAANNPRWLQDSGDPGEYVQIGKDIIGLHPIPSGTTDALELTLVAIPERYSGGADRVKLREAFKWAAVHYAVSEYYAGRGDAQSAMIHLNRYLEKLNIQTMHPKSAERQPFYRTK